MVNGIGAAGFSGAQALRALNAFKMDDNVVQKARKQIEDAITEPQAQQAQQAEPTVALREEMPMQKANEIKQYGQMFDMNISNSDINYALSYGRSVIVDYKA